MKISDSVLTFKSAQSGLDRSDGKAHVTGVLADLGTELQMSPWNKPDNVLVRHGEEFIELGFTWEEVIEHWEHLFSTEFGKRMFAERPGELELDGIVGSPDGIEWCDEEGHTVVHEYKCSWSSCNKPLEDNWRYMVQAKAYCKMAGTRFCRFVVLYVCGDYRRPSFPVAKIYDLEFTQEEVDLNWQMLVGHKEKKGL